MLITSNATRPRNQRKIYKEIAARQQRMATHNAKQKLDAMAEKLASH